MCLSGAVGRRPTETHTRQEISVTAPQSCAGAGGSSPATPLGPPAGSKFKPASVHWDSDEQTEGACREAHVCGQTGHHDWEGWEGNGQAGFNPTTARLLTLPKVNRALFHGVCAKNSAQWAWGFSSGARYQRSTTHVNALCSCGGGMVVHLKVALVLDVSTGTSVSVVQIVQAAAGQN